MPYVSYEMSDAILEMAYVKTATIIAVTAIISSRGFSVVHNIFVKPELGLNLSPVNTKYF